MKNIIDMIRDFLYYGIASSGLQNLKTTSDRKHGVFTYNGVKYAYSNYNNDDEITLLCII